ncbi:tRNA guanosine(34) transglycosylase Tgt [Leptospira stimsonii]|uniref:Queuine tRNA-ribosyltransferase n=1 Tax=Leptospira stimsonii TaxID=2202203 RepID=A0ABY2MVF5_9LEPT|nr:tRNA guanosine(34) transglycosylase Tgt [Leptospira stimsonii]TGK13334.1 tRNA guanosine(34) transglycosylase Tgt [Leptospira stimsonii]TGM09112.1 tRNA guanosine(34) transglycosylase Tgt [Leptospira stimsonii]
MSRLNFVLEAEAPQTSARATTFTTLHGQVQTPIFMPVGTQATVRAQTVDSLKAMGSRVLLANTYHLLLRPGAEVFRKIGGIHKFMNWDFPVLTDSGGFQIFSLPNSRKMTEEGAHFRSYVDGKMILLSPELSIDMQRAIGSDIMMVLDQCIPSTADYAKAKDAMEITHRWAKRSLDARGDSPQSIFGIVQGACFSDLRKESAKVLTQMPFDGFAIGGLAVGETKEERNDFCELSASLLPKNLPRYLMGVGTPIDLLEAVHRGVDMFDCTIPTELAQHGVAYTSAGKLQIHRTIYKFADSKLDENCDCPCCQNYSRSYLHHLIKTSEILGWHLIAQHNLNFYHRLMAEMRAKIFEGSFASYYARKKEELIRSDNVDPSLNKKRTPKAQRKRILGDYEIRENKEGKYWSVRQRSSGETMHSVNNPSEEAKSLYVVQTKLSEKLSGCNDSAEPESTNPFVIWDVGLGAATNSMAAIRCYEEIDSPVPMNMISFECDLDPFRLAMRNIGRFPHLFHTAPRSILEKGNWTSPSGTLGWDLVIGDFENTFLSQKIPDLVFYDPFSFKTDSKLWQPEFLKRLFLFFQDHSKNTMFVTYSASTAVRSSLLFAGFWVGKGKGSGPKSETTIAFTKRPENVEESTQLLGSDWLGRRERSHARFREEWDETKNRTWEETILCHPQFLFSP